MVRSPKKNHWYNVRVNGRYIAVKVVGFGFDDKNIVFIRTKAGNLYQTETDKLFNPLTKY